MTTSPIVTRSCCTTPSAMGFWTAMFALFYAVGLLVRSIVPALQPYGDTVILTALAAACVVNLRRNRTLHCGLTAPLFAIAAIVAGLIEAGLLRFDERVMWGVVIVGVAIAFLVEWRTVGRQRRASNA